MSPENRMPERPERFRIPRYMIDDIETIDDASIVNEIANRANKRFEIPQCTITDINTINDDLIVEEEAFLISAEIEPGDKEREKIVELLNSLTEPSSGNQCADIKKAEFIMAQLRAMGVPVDGFYNLLGIGIHPETVAKMMLEERADEGGPGRPGV